jgi:hypothetical protein
LFSALRGDPAAAHRRAESADYDEMNRVWREFFPTDPPARTTFALQLSNGVEIECIALARESPSEPALQIERVRGVAA